MVITVDMYAEIRRLWMEGCSQRSIAKRLQISRNTVKKYCAGAHVPWEQKPRQRSSPVVTDEVRAFIQACLVEDELHGLKKQSHTARRIYDRLSAELGFSGGESTVRNIVHEMRQKTAAPYVPLYFPAGSAAQVDWGEAVIYLAGKKTTVNLFCARLCYSCAPIVFAYRRQNEESFLGAFVRAFAYFGGVPKRIIFDNARVAVKEGFGAHARKQEGYAYLSAHYGFEAVFCNPASGHEKGLVEGLVGYIRRNVCVPIPQVDTLEELNQRLLAQCVGYGSHTISGKNATVGVMLAQERAALQPLPAYRFETARRIHTRVNRYCTVRFDTNNYSVPVDYCAREVTVKATPERIFILLANEVIAEHERSYARSQDILCLEHYFKLLEQRGRAIPFAKPVMQNIPADFMEWLNRQHDLTPKEMTQLLRRCQTEGCTAVMSNDCTMSLPPVIYDTVPVRSVDLGQYDTLTTRKVMPL